MPIKTLGEVARYINGRAFKPIEWENVGLPIIRIQNLTNTNSEFNRTSKRYNENFLVKDGAAVVMDFAHYGC
jgi:type I restriction enzyme S subunit